jgi:hypothetical protein
VTEQTTALTVVQRAVAAIGITAEREKELRDLAARTNGINAITNKDGYQQVHSGRMALKNERLSIQSLAKEARDDATKFSKAVIAEEKRIIAIISPEEDRLQKLQDDYDAAIEAEKQAKIAAEQKRVRDLQELVESYRGNQTLTASSGSALIAEHIEDLERQPVDESFQEFQEQAAEAKAAGLERLRTLHAAAVAHEAEQARIVAEREELARLRAEEEKRQAAERARLAEEERVAKAARDAEAARQAAELKAQREKQEAEAAAERKRIAEEEAAAKAARDAEAAKQAEELRLQREAQAKADAEAKAIRDAEAAKLAAERAEFERQQAEARKVKEEEERVKREQARLAAIKKPTDDELLGVLARHYNVPVAKVVEWVLAMDLSKDIAA